MRERIKLVTTIKHLKTLLIIFFVTINLLSIAQKNVQVDITLHDIYMQKNEFDHLPLKMYRSPHTVLLLDSRDSIVHLTELSQKQAISIKAPVGKYRLSVGVFLDTIWDTVFIISNDTKLSFTINTGLPEEDVIRIKKEALKDIENGVVQIKWLIKSSSDDISCVKMNNVSKKFDLVVDCIGSHDYHETVEYINTYNSVIFAHLSKKHSDKELKKLAKRLAKKW